MITERSSRFLFLIAMCLVVAFVPSGLAAKSLYVVEEHHAGLFAAYNVNPDGTLTKQANYSLAYHALGPSGLAVDADSATIFVTYESSNVVELVDADTMLGLGNTIAPGAYDLAGIDVDDVNDIVYTVDRGTPNLFAYDWDPIAETLTLRSGYPVALPNCGGGFRYRTR